MLIKESSEGYGCILVFSFLLLNKKENLHSSICVFLLNLRSRLLLLFVCIVGEHDSLCNNIARPHLLLLVQSQEGDTRDLDDLEADTGHVTDGLALATEPSNEHFVLYYQACAV